MSSIESSTSHVSVDYSLSRNNFKQKQSEEKSHELVSTTTPVPNLFNTILNRQVGSLQSIATRFLRPSKMAVQSSREMAFQLTVKNIEKKRFSTTEITTHCLNNIIYHPMENGEIKGIAISFNDFRYTTQSRIQIYHLSPLKIEWDIELSGSVRKVISLTQNVLTLTYSSPDVRKISFYSLTTRQLTDRILSDDIPRSFNFINSYVLNHRLFLHGQEELHEYTEGELKSVDSNKIAPGLMDRHYTDTFVCMGSSSYIIRANGEKIAITDLKDLTKNQVIKINATIIQWIDLHHLSDNKEEEVGGGNPSHKRARLSRSTSDTSKMNHTNSILPAFAETKRSFTTYHLSEDLLYFGTIITNERIELGWLDLSTKKIVKMIFPEPMKEGIKPLKKIVVCKEKKWFCYGDAVGELGVINLKNGSFHYLGNHENTTRISTCINFTSGISDLSTSNDVLVSTRNGSFKIWNLRNLQLLHSVKSVIKQYSEPFLYDNALFFYGVGTRSLPNGNFTKYDFVVPSPEIETLEESDECAPTPVLRTFSDFSELAQTVNLDETTY